jgi:hypothetical protein
MATGQSYVLPAPVGGLNARDALANMPETDAVVMDNWFPGPSSIAIRAGYTAKATFTGNCETVLAYNGLTGNKLFAAVNNAGTRSIYDITSGGAVSTAAVGGAGNTVQAVTSTQYDWAMFGTASAEVLVLVNGTDNLLLFDGTTWYSVTGVSSPYAITGVTTSTLNTVGVYKQRLWFGQKGTFNVWYLPIQQFAGAATQLNLASLFKLGGSLQSIVTISIDNAAGANDYIAFVSTVGEVIVYNGYDPSSVSTWALSAHFRIGRPIATGRRCWAKTGSDAVIICADGFIALSEALLTDRSQTRNALSDKIRNAVNNDVALYGGNPGWQIVLFPIGNKLIINVPSATTASYQYVNNTITNTWCTFGKSASSWGALCFETQGDSLYFGANGLVGQADTGATDNGAPITAYCQQAFTYFGNPGQVKQFTMARPIFMSSGPVNTAVDFAVDFSTVPPTSTIPYTVGNSAVWNTALWTTPTYWSDAALSFKSWISVRGIGYAASVIVRTQTTNTSLSWSATNFIYKPGAIFG